MSALKALWLSDVELARTQELELNQSAYRVYYEWKGPSASDPFAAEKSRAQIYSSIQDFTSELAQCLPDLEAKVDFVKQISGATETVVHITTTCTQNVVEQAIVLSLKRHRLFAETIEANSVG